MNFNKHKFTVEEFMTLPVYEEARLANTGEVFLLKGRFSFQKDYLKQVIDENGGEANLASVVETRQKNSRSDQQIKVKFWKKHKDGNFGEFGGVIVLQKSEGILVKDDKLILKFGDENLAFNAAPTSPIDNDTSFGDAPL
jgi:hypothetical protein